VATPARLPDGAGLNVIAADADPAMNLAAVCLPYDVNIIGAEMSETILLEFAPLCTICQGPRRSKTDADGNVPDIDGR
jgi:hypothetical protein